MRVRSIYHLKEADPSAFVLPRLTGAAQAGLAELLYDEYGGGRAERLHSGLFARGMADAAWTPTYGAYVDEAPTEVLEQNNALTMFGLHRPAARGGDGAPRGVRGDQLPALAPDGPGPAAAGAAGEPRALLRRARRGRRRARAGGRPRDLRADGRGRAAACARTCSWASSPASTRRTGWPATCWRVGGAA